MTGNNMNKNIKHEWVKSWIAWPLNAPTDITTTVNAEPAADTIAMKAPVPRMSQLSAAYDEELSWVEADFTATGYRGISSRARFNAAAIV
jgi:hypothetical protein